MALGTLLKNLSSRTIEGHGQLLTVARLGRATDLSIRFLVQPYRVREQIRMRLEGSHNAANAEHHVFVCAGDADVAENDTITYSGFKYRVMEVSDQPEGGVNVARQCVAARSQRA